MNQAHQIEEVRRLASLRKYSVLDTPPESVYDEIVELARVICQTPIVIVSLVDESRQWFKAKIGIETSETPREGSFCSHLLSTPDQIFVVEDAALDPRFADNTFVTGAPHIRFYAGAPLVDSEGMVLGALCVVDRRPRKLAPEQLRALRTLARQVVIQIEALYRAKQLKDSETRAAKFMDCSPAVIFIKDRCGKYVYVNRTYLSRFERHFDQVIGKDDFELWPQATALSFRSHDEETLCSGKTTRMTHAVPGPNGSLCYWQTSKFLLPEQGLLGGVAIDITELKQSEAKLQASREKLEKQRRLLEATVADLRILSTTDTLTGLKNRGAFESIVLREWAAAARYNKPISLLMMDLDHFKRVNDTLGHQGGDALLRAVGQMLKADHRVCDLAARFGGEEFIVLLPNTNEAGACVFAERFREEVEKLKVATISIGVAAKNAVTLTPQHLIRQADDALYQAKRLGRNRVCQASALAIAHTNP